MQFLTWLFQFLNAPTPLQSAKAKRMLASREQTRQLILAIRRERGQHSLADPVAMPYLHQDDEVTVVKVGEANRQPAPANPPA